MKTKTVVVGAGGHAKSVIDIAKKCSNIEIIGCIANCDEKYVCGVPVIGNDDIIPKLLQIGAQGFFVAIGDNVKRAKIYNKMLETGLKPVNIISPYAVVSDSAILGKGICIMHNAVIHVDSKIGDNCIINTGAVVDHDCRIEKNCHISVSASVCGGVFVGENTLIAPGSVIRNYIKIGKNTIIGMSSVVTKDIEDNAVVYGNPAKFKRSNKI